MDLIMLHQIRDDIQKYNARLLPVIKGRTIKEILKVYEEGFREFGENRLEELLNHKISLNDCHFHFGVNFIHKVVFYESNLDNIRASRMR